MIGRIRGLVVSARETTICIEVGGVGYEVEMTPRDLIGLPGIGHEVVVHTHTHVREDDISLYGFDTENDREMFRVLLTASGVGPKVAMALLGSMTADQVLRAIIAEDADALTIAPGIGKRGAQKIVLELAPKLAGRPVDLTGGDVSSVRNALEGLGYSTSEINQVLTEVDTSSAVADQIKTALQNLGRR